MITIIWVTRHLLKKHGCDKSFHTISGRANTSRNAHYQKKTVVRFVLNHHEPHLLTPQYIVVEIYVSKRNKAMVHYER